MKKRKTRSQPKKPQGVKQAQKHRKQMKRRVFEALDLPEEVLPGVPKMTLCGREDLLIENHRGVLEYGEERVRILTEMGVVCITGEELMLSELGTERIYVRGRVNSCLYEA